MRIHDHDALQPDYLGDGVYVSHDGYHVWICAERGGRAHEVALEPGLVQKLIEYVERINKPDGEEVA